jgi:hypothetical protein
LIAAVCLPLAGRVVWQVLWDIWAGTDVEHHVPRWRMLTGYVVMVGGAVWLVVASGQASRGAERARAGRSRCRGLWALTGPQRRALRRQVTGSSPAVADDLPATTALARTVVDQRLPWPLALSSGLPSAGVALSSESTAAVVAAVVMVAVTAHTLALRWRGDRAERFLAEHPVDLVPAP